MFLVVIMLAKSRLGKCSVKAPSLSAATAFYLLGEFH